MKNIFRKKRLSVSILSVIISITVFAGEYSFANNRAYTRYHGVDRVRTSIESAKTYDRETLVIAPAYSFQDAISAMNIANKFDGRLVLINKETTIPNFDINAVKKVYIVGGSTGNRYVSDKLDSYLKQKANVVRVTGKDVYETNKKTLEISGYKTVGVATANIYADALSAYSIVREESIGIMLVDGKKPYNSNGYSVKYTFGGKNTVVQDGGIRISGVDRYDTSNKIAKKTAYKNLVFVDGRNYADSMSAINITNSKLADIVLTPRNKNEETLSIVRNASEIFAVGGPNSIEDAYLQQAINGVEVSKDNYVYYPDGLMRIKIPISSSNSIVYRTPNTVAEEETAITFYSKYHYGLSSNKNEPEGSTADLAIVDMNFSYPSTWVELGRISKNGVNKKVVAFILLEPTFSNTSSDSVRRYKDSLRVTFDTLRNNIEAVDGAVYTKVHGDPLKKYELR